MAEGWGPTAGNAALTTVTAAYPWAQLAIGAPGAAGTSNTATETSRKQISTFGTASAGTQASSAAITWTSIAGSQTATKMTFWTASTAGTFGLSGSVTASAYTAGDTVTFASGAITYSVTLAS
jgi:hypothetical protein